MTETAATPASRRRGAPIRRPELHDPAWLQAAVDQGLTRTDIAAKLGSTRHTVSGALSRHRISAGKPGRPAVHPQLHDPAWLQAAIDSGLTQTVIAADVGCAQSAVSRALHRHNIRRSAPSTSTSGDVPDGGAPVGDTQTPRPHGPTA